MRHKLVHSYYGGDEYLQKLRGKMMKLKELEQDPYIRAERILNIYSVDPVSFIEDFCFLKIPEYGEQIKPFFLFDFQKKIIYAIQDAERSGEDVDLLIDKPRGMGLTWLISAYLTWRWLFTPNYSSFILSRTEAEVDDGTNTPNSTIFGKIRWQLSKMPKWMLPEGYQPKKSRGTTTDMNLRILNPQIQSAIVGSSTNSNAGRSRRYSLTMIDECFFIDNFQEVYRALTSVSRVKLFVSTVVESKVAKDFRDMCETKGHYVSLTWRDHPWKDQIWFNELEEKARLLDDPDLMREAVVDYSVNPKSQYYPMVVESKVDSIQYERQRPLYCSLDVGGRQDLTVIGYWQFDGEHFKLVEAYENTNKPAEWYAPFLNTDVLLNPMWYNEFQQRFIENLKKWNRPVAYFGELDHTIKRMPTNTSTADELWKAGRIKIQYNQYAIQHPPRHAATSKMLPKTIFNKDSPGALKVYDAICTSKYAGTLKTTAENLKPIHGSDGTADRRAMVENFAVQIPRLFRNQRDENMNEHTRDFARAITKMLRI